MMNSEAVDSSFKESCLYMTCVDLLCVNGIECQVVFITRHLEQ